jgi:MYXO-CTERM domain-containing protein
VEVGGPSGTTPALLLLAALALASTRRTRGRRPGGR